MHADRTALELTLLPGARELLDIHSQELPQRDDLCGAFCAALALRAAGVAAAGGEALDQDAVALAAGSIVSAVPDHSSLPLGERGRRDYRISPPLIDDPALAGTTAAGLLAAVAQLSEGALAALPYSGPWSAVTLGGLFEVASRCGAAVSLLANLATRHLWGGRPTPLQLLGYLLEGDQAGPQPDWDVGHFVCVAGRIAGPRGSLYALADTYPALGSRGLHLQPAERLAAALERPDMPAGGMIVVASASDAPALRVGAAAAGLQEGLWDNGSATAETTA